MFNKRLAAIAAVIRSFNNKSVGKQVKNLLTIGIGKVIVICNAVPDKGSTRGYLDSLLDDGRVQLLEMVEGYSWSNALNLGMRAVSMSNINRKQEGKPEYRFIFNVSVEALFAEKHIEAMLDCFAENPYCGMVGTSFEGRQDGNVISLGRSYKHPRNTGAIISIEAIKQSGALLGGFDAWCDGIGGMEDINFMLEMLATSSIEVEHLDLKVPLVVGNNHHQPTKENKEREAMDKIIARWRSYFAVGTEERTRIDAVIAKMGVEEVA